MTKCTLTVSSRTLASKGVRTLVKAGIRAETVTVDPSVTARGCGFGIQIPCADADRAKTILSERGIGTGDLLAGGL